MCHGLRFERGEATIPFWLGENHAFRARPRGRTISVPIVLDSVVTAETPEGILLEMRPAGLSARFAAFVIDWLIRLAILYAMAFRSCWKAKRDNSL